MSIYFQGLMLGFAMIIPIGPQNAFVIMQGIRRQYYLMTALLCALSDMLLLMLGVFGSGFLFSHIPWLLHAITLAGIAFLLWYGWGAFKSVWHIKRTKQNLAGSKLSRKQIIMTLLAVTWLNPHVYLDTVVVLGSVGGQFDFTGQQWFVAGAVTASFVWFFSISLLAAKFAVWLQKPVAQIIIHSLVGCIMWVIAYQLAMYYFQSVWG